jgi:hypothetical protein
MQPDCTFWMEFTAVLQYSENSNQMAPEFVFLLVNKYCCFKKICIVLSLLKIYLVYIYLFK